MSEDIEIALKRCRIRSWRRGMKEMDLILGPYADHLTPDVDAGEFAALVALLDENDQELYAWMTGVESVPERHIPTIAAIQRFHGI